MWLLICGLSIGDHFFAIGYILYSNLNKLVLHQILFFNSHVHDNIMRWLMTEQLKRCMAADIVVDGHGTFANTISFFVYRWVFPVLTLDVEQYSNSRTIIIFTWGNIKASILTTVLTVTKDLVLHNLLRDIWWPVIQDYWDSIVLHVNRNSKICYYWRTIWSRKTVVNASAFQWHYGFVFVN